jgi:hypothetical protein
MADPEAVWFRADDEVVDLPTFPSNPALVGDCACPWSPCEQDPVIDGLCMMCRESCVVRPRNATETQG